MEREFFIDNLLVRIHFIIVMSRCTGLAPWDFESPFPALHLPSMYLCFTHLQVGGSASRFAGGNVRLMTENFIEGFDLVTQ